MQCFGCGLFCLFKYKLHWKSKEFPSVPEQFLTFASVTVNFVMFTRVTSLDFKISIIKLTNFGG